MTCRLLLSSLMLAACTLGWSQDDHWEPDVRGYIVSVGDPMPEFTLISTEGESFTRSSLLGKTYVLQFTASWCGVCRQEMPHLETEVWQRFKSENFALIGVDLDEPLEKVAAFADQMQITYPIAPDPDGQVFYSIAAPKSGVTRNIVVDTEGRIAFLTRLYEREEFEAMVEVIEDLLNP